MCVCVHASGYKSRVQQQQLCRRWSFFIIIYFFFQDGDRLRFREKKTCALPTTMCINPILFPLFTSTFFFLLSFLPSHFPISVTRFDWKGAGGGCKAAAARQRWRLWRILPILLLLGLLLINRRRMETVGRRRRKQQGILLLIFGSPLLKRDGEVSWKSVVVCIYSFVELDSGQDYVISSCTSARRREQQWCWWWWW